MSQIVKLRRSSVSGQKPTNSNLQLGELALNTTDGKVYMAKSGSLGPSVEEIISTNTVNTGSIHLVGSISASHFTGSFKGDGSQLYNIPSSGITGLNLSMIADGNSTASISNSQGLKINTNTEITGSLIVSSGSAVFDASLQLTENSSLILNSGSNLYVYDGGIISGTFKGNGALLTDLPYATTASNHFFGDQTITGSVLITQNLTVLGSSSITYITSSQLEVATSFISVNVYEPAERFGGLKVYDSGSSTATASLAWDSLRNHWVYQNVSGSTYSGGMLLAGPRNSGSLGDEPSLISGRIVKSVGGDHLDNSNITDSGTKVSINSNTEITGSLHVTGGLTGSIDFNNLTNVPTLVSGSSQISITGTTGYSTFSSSIDTLISSSINALSASIASTDNSDDSRLDSLEIESGSIRSDFNSFTSSYTTGSFTGSFIGDGSQLYNVPASGVTGLNLSQIDDGSATASISNTNGFRVNTNSEISGSLFVSGTLNIGEISILDPMHPEIVHIQNSGSNNGLVVIGNSNQYYQTYIANSNTGSGASTDLVIGSDNATDTEHYLDLGINSSTYTANYVGYENDSYLYAASDDLYIGTLGLSNRQSDVHIFTSNSWQNPQITVSGSGQIGFNTQTVDSGRQYQFSGSAKFENGARFEESIDVQYNVTANNYVDTPMVYHGGDFELRTNGVINLNSIYGKAVNVTGSLNVAGTITATEFHTTFVTSSVMYTSGSTKFGDTSDDTHQFTGSVKILGSIDVPSITGSLSGSVIGVASDNLRYVGVWTGTTHGYYFINDVVKYNNSLYVCNNNVFGNGTPDVDASFTLLSDTTPTGSFLTTSSFNSFTSSYTTGSFTGSFIGDATGLTNVPFYISGSNISGTTVGKTFTKLQFDDSTGLNVDETEPGTAFISIGSHFKDIFVSGSPVLSATGSDAFEIIGLGGIHISSSTVDTNGNGYVKELTFDLTEISSSLDYRINAITGLTGGGVSDGGYATLNQTTLAATWSFNHNLGQRYPIVQVFDTYGKVIIPSEVIMVDSSTTTITFPSAQIGKAVASLGTGPGGMTQFFTSAATWSLQHDMGADYPIVTIYDVNKNIIFPDRVTSIDSNNIEVGFTTPVAGHLNVAKGGHIISGSINFSNISTAGSGIVSSSIQVYNYGYATTGSNAFNGSQLIKNAKIDATCLSVTSGTSTIFSVSGYDGATFDYVVKSGVNRRAGTIVAIWDGSNSKFTETTTPDLGDTSNVTFTVSSTGALNAVVSSGTWTVEAMYRALNCS